MILCLDVGNTLTTCGVFDKGELRSVFRFQTKQDASSDELGMILRGLIRVNDISPHSITHIAFCTVVPALTHSLKACCLRYFRIHPFILQAGTRTGLKIKYRNPLEVGSDRISNAIAATNLFPDENVIIADLGTANTFCAITANKEYLGGCITPGLKISARALEDSTAQLPSVAIVGNPTFLGRSTIEGIQSGLFYGTLGMIKEIIQRLSLEAFKGKPARVIGTSGFANLFAESGVFDQVIPDLALRGLIYALALNGESGKVKPVSSLEV